MTTADNIASLGLISGFVHAAAIGLLDIVLPAPRRGGMSYDEVLSATLGHRRAQGILAEWRKKKRRGRRAREREMLIFAALP
jgi:hypothetical protein